MNIELASLITLFRIAGMEQRSQYIQRHGKLSFFHYDFTPRLWLRLKEVTRLIWWMSGNEQSRLIEPAITRSVQRH